MWVRRGIESILSIWDVKLVVGYVTELVFAELG
jgi:hypothetical protein